MWIDLHAHLFDLDNNQLAVVLDRALQNQVFTIVNAGVCCNSSKKVVQQLSQHRSLYGAVGISPFDVEDIPLDYQLQIQNLLEHEKVIAIGEIGLDSSNPRYPALDLQIPVFRSLLSCAKNANLPVIVHSRGAEQLTFDLCREQCLEKVIFHCYTGSVAILKKIIDSGYSISFSGIITFSSNSLYEHVVQTPITQLFIETDTPYLSPSPHRGKSNEPCNVVLVGQKIAEMKQVCVDSLHKSIQQNFLNTFTKIKGTFSGDTFLSIV